MGCSSILMIYLESEFDGDSNGITGVLHMYLETKLHNYALAPHFENFSVCRVT